MIVQADLDLSVSFLRWWGFPCLLIAIAPDRQGIEAGWFEEADESRPWIEDKVARKWNCYFHVNPRS
jgi:hypothetical protein